MSDLVERLRERSQNLWTTDSELRNNQLFKEAAARIEQLEAEAKTRTLDYLGQVGQLSEELERVKREAERAQDAHGVRFLNYLEETARLTDEIDRLRSVLEVAADRLFDAGLNDAWADARAALKEGE